MKKIVVFGGTGGLGKKIMPLLNEKYNVISLGSKDVDITNFNEVKDFFNKNKDIDIVLNLSGKKYDVFLNEISNNDYESIQDMINVNIIGNINILAGCLPNMIENKYGRVIAMSSIFADMNISKNAIYCASKAFLDRLISNANKENIKYGITCNTIQLGYYEYGMGERVEDKYKEMAKNKIGLKRFCKVEEIYNVINFIVENEYVCGVNLKIDGGL
jgi:NADP-dependent 3-hydroxy acid dehydrogenase YdfG